MRAVLQRVHEASVTVDGRVVGEIGTGVLALIAATHTDTAAEAATMARKIAEIRLLADDTSIQDHVDDPGDGDGDGDGDSGDDGDNVRGARPAVLVVSQFTLYGSTKKGRRPSWSDAAPGPVAEPLVDLVAAGLRERGVTVATGEFGADMDVALVNDGPFTLVIDT